jgi:hypothetical protein
MRHDMEFLKLEEAGDHHGLAIGKFILQVFSLTVMEESVFGEFWYRGLFSYRYP